MEVNGERVVPVVELSQVGEARRAAAEISRALAFDEDQCGRVAVVVTEAATNLVKHAGGGEIVLQGFRHGALHGIDVLALDRGPGMPDVDRAMVDGFSTRGSPGTGLGAIVRLSDAFDVYSVPGEGTALLARLTAGVNGGAIAETIGGVAVPMRGESLCGDGWAAIVDASRIRVLVTDGLGHGAAAAAASARARQVLFAAPRHEPVDLVRQMHDALRPTRGAAVALVDLERDRGVLRFVGVGNIAGSILAAGSRRGLVSAHGTLGHDVRKIQEFQYPWPADAALVLHSDGLVSGWKLDRSHGLASRSPTLVAAVLYRDFQRGRDDTTVVVVKGM